MHNFSNILESVISMSSFDLITALFAIAATLSTCKAFAPKGMVSMVVDHDASFSTSCTLTSVELQSQRFTTTLSSSSRFSTPNFRDFFTVLSSNENVLSSGTDKRVFFESLDRDDTLNQASKERTTLLNKMVEDKVITEDLKTIPGNIIGKEGESTLSLKNPGLVNTFDMVASGTWKVVYAPHMTTIAGLFGGNFDVQYTLNKDGTMVSHARYDFPIINSGYLSVSGSYGSIDENVSRVDFENAWVKPLIGDNIEDIPYDSLDAVPDSFVKDIVNSIGKVMFIDAFAIFPVSFLDDDTIVFDFELLGTRICAKKA